MKKAEEGVLMKEIGRKFKEKVGRSLK